MKPFKQFELRWAVRETGKQLMDENGYYYPETTKTLEFRARHNTPFPGSTQLTPWSEWTEVPTEYFKYENI